MVTLDEIVNYKRQEVNIIKEMLPEKQLKKGLKKIRQVRRGFRNAITNSSGIRIIAEIKQASPSLGVIREDFNVMKIARCYEHSGVAAISVLTETKYFLGRPSHLCMAREQTKLPVLRKDFLIDHYQITESAVLGADAALLIVAILQRDQLREFISDLEDYKVDPLVEVHTEDELEIALSEGADLIGINNRNLKTMEVNVETTEQLIEHIPEETTVIAESGFETHTEIKRLVDCGVDAFLIGTSILSSMDMEQKIKELRGISR